MSHAPLPYPTEEPFVAEISYSGPPGKEVPMALIRLTGSMPHLAAHVGLDAVGLLAVVVSTHTANGGVGPSAAQVGAALGRPAWAARLALLRVARRHWRGQPLMQVVRRASGYETFHPTPIVLGRRQSLPPSAAAPPSAAPAGREAVISASREKYSRPRSEVEREVIASLGLPSPEEMAAAAAAMPKKPADLNARWAVERLVKAGVDYPLSVKLVNDFGPDRCLRQLRFIEYRRVKSRARYLVAAIRGDYQQPPNYPTDAEGAS